jgi:hypothetical protein
MTYPKGWVSLIQKGMNVSANPTKYNYHLNDFTPYHGRAIFVFGSNLAGIHGKGAAKYAAECLGAGYGIGVGYTGGCYALPTKDEKIKTLPLVVIEGYIKSFKEAARYNDGTKFFVTRVGCGLAGYTDEQIAPLFKGASENCVFPIEWQSILEE